MIRYVELKLGNKLVGLIEKRINRGDDSSLIWICVRKFEDERKEETVEIALSQPELEELKKVLNMLT